MSTELATVSQTIPTPATASPGRAPRPAWTLVLASLGLFMTALDTLVVTTALPVLRADLRASLSSLEWTVNAYNLSFACFLLTGAALGDRYGRRRVFLCGLALFTTASAAAALSPTVGALIAARALQGAAAAIVMPLTLTLICAAFPDAKRGAAIGLWGGICGLAVAAGPVVGGAVVSGIDWHWIFWLNVPIGIVLIPAARARLRESYGPPARLDWRGVLLAGAALLSMCWGLVRTTTLGWASGQVLAALLAGLALLTAFIGHERRTRSPMLPLGLFRGRGFAAANAVSFFMYAGLFGALFLMAQYLQNALGYTPLQAGLRLLPWTAPPMFIAPLAGALADRYGSRPFMIFGLMLQATGYGAIALLAGHGSTSYLALGLAFTLAGTGTSFCFPTVATTVMTSTPPEHAGPASGTNSALRELGGVFGVAVLASVFTGHGGYTNVHTFTTGFSAALWVAAALSAIGIGAATLIPRTRRAHTETTVHAQPPAELHRHESRP